MEAVPRCDEPCSSRSDQSMFEFSGRSDELTLRDVCLDIELFLFSSNLDWERMVNGFCYFSLLFLYFSFKIVNVHNIFEGFVWGLGKYC